jgi:hypothetical protein
MSHVTDLIAMREALVARRRTLVEAAIKTPKRLGDLRANLVTTQDGIDACDRAIADEKQLAATLT